MKQLIFLKPGKLEWREAGEPRIQAAADALVRPLAVARCDLDAYILFGRAPFTGRLAHFLRNHLPEFLGQNRLFRRAPFKGPYAFGHEGVAEVVDVGSGVKSIRPQDRVIVPFQISCGSCETCARGLTANCKAVPPRSMYGFGELGGKDWGGFLSDLVRVPFADHMLVPLPPAFRPATLASASDNLCDAYRAVAPHLRKDPGAGVLVVGGGALSVGLYAAGIAAAMGAAPVHYVDSDPARLQTAQTLGATPIPGPPPRRVGQYRITVDASADPSGLSCALLSTEPGGVCTSVSIYYASTTPLPLLAMYGTGVTFTTGRVNASACLPDVLRLVKEGSFHPEVVTSRTATWEEAPEALLDPSAKVVITRESPGRDGRPSHPRAV